MPIVKRTKSTVEQSQQGFLIVVSAPSGGGKTTICNALLKADRKLTRSISATTRAPRGGEKQGRDYHFITEKQFKQYECSKKFLEWADVHGNFYGTLKAEVQKKIKVGKDVLLVIDVQGGLAVKQQDSNAVLIFVQPPSLTVLKKRLKNRATDDAATIGERLKNAEWEMKQVTHYDYVVVNEKLEKAIEDVRSIIKAERLKVKK